MSAHKTSMKTIKGLSVYKQIGFGKLLFINHKQNEIINDPIENIDAELLRFNNAKNQAIQELKKLYSQVLLDNGEDTAEIFEVHQMMIQDADYINDITHLIKNNKSSEFAILNVSKKLQESFLSIEDEYLRARAADIRDISQRLINILQNKTISFPDNTSKFIIVSDDLLPSETLHLDLNRIAGFVMFEGSNSSHAAILARMKEIPTIIKTDLIDLKYEKNEAIINSVDGELYINPDKTTRDVMKYNYDNLYKKQLQLKQLKLVTTKTLDGVALKVMANISQSKDLKAVLSNGAEGVGLFRTEFLYINRSTYPSEDEQFEEYKKVLQEMNDRQVIIRTMDIGTDKTADYFKLPKENNPALGYRAIRISLDRSDILKTQLKALLRASVYGHLGIMFPMITSVWEIKELKEHLKNAQLELESESVPIGNYEIGIMIETPASALISDDLAKEVDFFSVGTNDLTQYTLAVDRQNAKVNQYENPKHKSILRLIAMASENIHKHPNKWIGICGELAADLDLTPFFISIGIDELSVSPTYILPLREKILSLKKTDCTQFAKHILNTSR